MNTRDPKLTALLFSECINTPDLEGLAELMTEDHAFVNRNDGGYEGNDLMTKG